MITVSFACGHSMQVSERAEWTPRCGCGETRVAAVKAPAPRFVGTVTGPYCETKGLDPAVVNVATGGSLTLKQEN